MHAMLLLENWWH